MIAVDGALQSRFLSTPSVRRATHDRRGRRIAEPISIHALREEGDHQERAVLPFSP